MGSIPNLEESEWIRNLAIIILELKQLQVSLDFNNLKIEKYKQISVEGMKIDLSSSFGENDKCIDLIAILLNSVYTKQIQLKIPD